jgi:hypothetical protein
VTTGASAIIIEKHYLGGAVPYERATWLEIKGLDEHSNMRDPLLSEPIDFEAEIALRRETHEPLQPIDGELHNDLFGI